MSQIIESLLEAMKTIAKKEIDKVDKNITIQAKIKEVKDEAKGLYDVEYLGNSFEASCPTRLNLVQNDLVSILIPNGDMSDKNKIILGAISNNINELGNSSVSVLYNEKSENFISNNEEFSFCSYSGNQEYIFFIKDSEKLFKNYRDDYHLLKLSFFAKVGLANDNIQGDYGVKIIIPAFDENLEEVEKEIVLNRLSAGDPNNNTGEIYCQREQIFDMEHYTYNPDKDIAVKVFCKDFIENKNITKKDIFIRNISLVFVEKINGEENETYSLNIVPTESKFFSKSFTQDKTLIPELKVKGKKTDISQYEILWFKENGQITSSSEEYSPYGGYGWECLNNKIAVNETLEGEKTYKFNSMFSLEVKKSDIITSMRYKCVVLVKTNEGATLAEDIIEIKNLLSNISIDIIPNNGNVFLKDIGEISLTGKVNNYTFSKESIPYFYWTRFSKEGNFIEQLNTNRGTITFPVNKVNKSNTVSLTVVEGIGGKERIIGSKSIQVFNSEDTDFQIEVLNLRGFKYDADGNAPTVINLKEVILPLKFSLSKTSGTKLSEIEYNNLKIQWKVPKNSMIKPIDAYSEDNDFYIVTEKDLQYSVSERYDRNKTDNYILLEVQYGNRIYSKKEDLLFIKDGANGTNGTALFARIKPLGLEKIKGVYDVKTQEWYVSEKGFSLLNGTSLEVEVFNNNEKLPSSEFTVSSWEMLDMSVSNPCFTIQKNGSYGILQYSKKWFNKEQTYCNIVKVTITINTKAYSNQQLTALYPIDVIRIDDISKVNYFSPEIDEGFSEVLYASDGTNPSYIDKKFLINKKTGISFSFSATCNSNLKIKEQDDYGFLAFPISKYDNGDSKNYFKVSLDPLPINEDKSLLESEKLKLQKELQNVLDVKSKLIEGISNFNYNTLLSLLENSKNLLCYRSTGIRMCEIILQKIDYINSQHIEVLNLYAYTSKIKNLQEELYNLCKRENLETLSFDVPVLSYEEKEEYSYEEELIKNSIIELNSFKSKILENLEGLKKPQMKEELNAFKSFYKTLYALTYSYFGFDKTIQQILAAYTGDITNQRNLGYHTFFQIENVILKNFKKTIYYYGSVSSLNSETRKEFEEKENDYQQRIDELSEKINILDEWEQIYNQTFIYIKPIIMLYNCYEMSNLNGWDGNKIYTDGNGEYILAPQLGAGRKENNNTFTGLIMGLKSHNGSTSTEAGLYGYQKGVMTIQLNAEDGSAKFGRSGSGQILINPYGTSTIAGWEINSQSLSKASGSNKVILNSEASETAKAFEATNGTAKTYIQYNGFFYSNSGQVGSWIMENGVLKSKNGSIVFDAENESITCGKHFSVDKNGSVTMDKGIVGDFTLCETGLYNKDKTAVLSSVKGVIAKKGSIGGWKIEENQLSASNGNVYLKSDGSAKFGEHFYVDNDGDVKMNSGTVGSFHLVSTGLYNDDKTVVLSSVNGLKVSKGNIAGWKIEEDKLTGGNVVLNKSGALAGTKWSISAEGLAKFENLRAIGGTVGGWAIGASTLKGGNVTLNKSGALSGTNWSITAGGKATFSDINATGGTIAISGSGTTINSSGATLGETKTKVGSKVIGTYVKDLCVDTLKAQKIKTSQLEADSVNGQKVSWQNIEFMSDIDIKYYSYSAAGAIVTSVLADYDTIDGKTVVTDITPVKVNLGGNHHLVNRISASVKYRTVMVLSGGGSREDNNKANEG